MVPAALTRFDVAVVGGGPAGSAAAFAAAAAGCDVVLLERSSGERRNLGESLPPVAGRLLRQVFGAKGALDPSTHTPSYGTRAAWGSDVVVSNDFVLDPEGQGWHLDRARFDASLRDLARGCGVDVRTRVELRTLRPTGDAWSLATTGGNLSAGVVIDATGRPATAARATGASRRTVDHLVAAVAYFSANDADADATALVEAVESGWWYTSRLPDGQRVVMFLTDGDLLDRQRYRSADGWRTQLRATHRVGELIAGDMCGSPTLVAADTAALNPVFGDRWLATGDAALSFDPLSSLGILTAVEFGAAAGSAAVSLLDGDTGPTARYATRLVNHFAGYLAERERVYDAERRWPASLFWRRRAASNTAVTSAP